MLTNYWNGSTCNLCNGKACTVCRRQPNTKVIASYMSQADYRKYLRKLFDENHKEQTNERI